MKLFPGVASAVREFLPFLWVCVCVCETSIVRFTIHIKSTIIRSCCDSLSRFSNLEPNKLLISFCSNAEKETEQKSRKSCSYKKFSGWLWQSFDFNAYCTYTSRLWMALFQFNLKPSVFLTLPLWGWGIPVFFSWCRSTDGNFQWIQFHTETIFLIELNIEYGSEKQLN